MAYVGNPIDTQNTFQSLVGKRFNGDGSTTDFTLDVAPGNVLDIEVFVGNVRQDPNSAYTVSGTTLSFTGAPPSGTNNIYVVHQAKSVGTIDVPTGGVAAGSLGTSVLTGQTDIGAAIADSDLFLVDDGAGGTLRKTAASRIKTYAGFSVSDITGATELAETPADTDEFIISDAGTLKRIDYSYIKGEINTPAFFAHRSSNAGVSSGSTTLIQPDNELYDTDSAYNTSDGKFTVPSGKAGKYFFHAGVYFSPITDADIVSCEIYVNNSAKALVREMTGTSGNISVQCTLSVDLSAGDYVTYKVDQNSGSSLNTSGDTLTFLSGFRIA